MLLPQICGVRVQFTASLPALETYAQTHFGLPEGPQQPQEQPQILSHVAWSDTAPPRPTYDHLADGTVRLDRDIEVSHGELVWTRIDDFTNLHLRASYADERLRLQGRYYFGFNRAVWRDRMKKLWFGRRLPALRAKRFSTLLYYMVYYPTFWWLERRGVFPLHASAVELAEGGVVLCGLPGGGKSTLSLALLALPEARLLSDNLILYSCNRVFRCPEPVLVDSHSLELIGQARARLQPLGRQRSFGRTGYQVAPEGVTDQTAPRLFVFVTIGEKTEARCLSSQEAVARFTSANWIAQEVRRHLVYRTVLGLAYGGPGESERTAESTLHALVQSGHCYELTVGWGAGVPEAVERVRELLQ